MTSTTLLVPDLSEWQGSVNWGTLVGAGYPAVIIRVHNGSRADHQYEHNREQAHAHGVRALGLYAYLVPGRPAATQAAEFVRLVGSLRPGEWPILDYEEKGLTWQEAREWVDYVATHLHGAAPNNLPSSPWLYASDYPYRAEMLGERVGVPGARTWIAAYGPEEPHEDHELWQYTDHRAVPGVAGHVDCSVFHGDIAHLLAAVGTAAVRPPTKPTPGPTAHARFPFPAGLHPGGTQPSARPLQRALKLTGWLDSSVDESDHYGPKTENAVAGFNAKHGFNNAGVSRDTAIGQHGWALLMTYAYGRS